ncbi:nucleotidyltransferase substrate binding protein [Methanococcus maripaludis]|uniref:Nucleotidyltransferase substrate binding protein n=1 Tax=Methanococcus maripaludis TaxID=39152 RepID=A0A8T3VVI8_METMI|nr:nucleotidyltransferase substrate binding protein [Methanococcus maripaludis]MBG0768347.1 nucleotidyltransferase substrate binding protein [Methanococcus maripaludis]
MKTRWEEKLEDFKNVLDRLDEGLKLDISNSIVVDGVIQRFEFCYELAWKTVKYFLDYQGIEEVKSPRTAFREAHTYGLIENGDDWIDMLTDRNKTSRTYDEELAKRIYGKIKSSHFKNLKDLYSVISKEELKE